MVFLGSAENYRPSGCSTRTNTVFFPGRFLMKMSRWHGGRLTPGRSSNSMRFMSREGLRRRLRNPIYHVTCDQAFVEVITNCSSGTGREGGTWLFSNMIEAYTKMHTLGHAHSVEVWKEERLIGGVYGLAIAGLFAAESMFYRERDGSKIALGYLVAHLKARGYTLFDIQQGTEHTMSLGACEIPRNEYLKRLETAMQVNTSFGASLSGDVASL